MKLEAIIKETQNNVRYCIIWLHGLGADGYDFVDVIEALELPQQHGYRFIFPHAPIRPVTINANLPMRAWYDICSLANNSQEDDAGIRNSESLIVELIEEQIASGIHAEHIILAGFSQGGAMALHTAVRYTKRLCGIISLSAYLPLAPHLLNEAHHANTHTPIFLAHGKHDEIVPFSAGERTRDYLSAHHFSVEWHSYPIAHQVSTQEIQDINTWIKHHSA